jgi:hypothetical protein
MKDQPRVLVIKFNSCATNDPCEICGDRTDPDCGPELFLEGTFALVCYECGQKYAPQLVDMLFYWRAAKYKQMQAFERGELPEYEWPGEVDDAPVIDKERWRAIGGYRNEGQDTPFEPRLRLVEVAPDYYEDWEDIPF